MPSNIEWITGPVHTGKTTRLTERIADSPEQYCGLLAPIDSEGNRYLHDLVTGERRMLDCAPEAKDMIVVGPYIFSEAVFAWGRSILLSHQEEYPERTLVIDEIGKLELREQGLAPACWELIDQRNSLKKPTVLIVRDSLETLVKTRITPT
ncbi:MAG: nucleoside-triphosphatase [Saprospiraceae bacterium]